jgi:hypothetical protein
MGDTSDMSDTGKRLLAYVTRVTYVTCVTLTAISMPPALPEYASA